MESIKLDDAALKNVTGGSDDAESLRKKVDDLYVEIEELDRTIEIMKRKLEQEKQK